MTMTSLANWFSPTMLHAVGWTLLHSLWQITAVSALAAVFMTMSRRPSVRYLVGVGALVVMLLAPVATVFFLISRDRLMPADAAVGTSETASSSSTAAQTRLTTRLATRLATDKVAVGFSSASFGIPSSELHNILPWLVEAWLFGVAFFSLRSAGGFLLLERKRRKQSDAPKARILAMCRTLQRQLGLDRKIRYCECLWLEAPAVIGWFRPIVLLPVTALTGLSDEQLQAVIAHELAHIRRFDSFVNLFQIAVETLLFYHPAVWWLNRRIRIEREHCCDDIAIALCGDPVEYARALTVMEEWRSAPVLAMAANRGPLSERILRMLGRNSTGTRGIGFTGGVLCLTAALVSGYVLLGIAYPKPVVQASESFSAQNSAVAHVQGGGAPTASRSISRRLPKSPSQSPAAFNVALIAAAEPPAPVAPAAVAPPKTDAAPPPASSSYIDSMKAAGLDGLTVDQLIALKIQNITPEYVRGIHEQGLHPDAESLIAMRIQGVMPEYIRDLRALGFTPGADELVGLKIQGVDAAYVKGLKEAGLQPRLDELIALKIQSVTPAYVSAMRKLGLEFDANKLVEMRIQGLTPEYVGEIRGLGLKPTVDEFVTMRIQSVTPQFVKALQTAGFTFDVSEIIAAKIQGITPEFIESAREHGFQNLSLEKLIQLKQMGILPRAEI
jgi:beta-lactamase regulating signal transducer with metallopeptidase domain